MSRHCNIGPNPGQKGSGVHRPGLGGGEAGLGVGGCGLGRWVWLAPQAPLHRPVRPTARAWAPGCKTREIRPHSPGPATGAWKPGSSAPGLHDLARGSALLRPRSEACDGELEGPNLRPVLHSTGARAEALAKGSPFCWTDRRHLVPCSVRALGALGESSECSLGRRPCATSLPTEPFSPGPSRPRRLHPQQVPVARARPADTGVLGMDAWSLTSLPTPRDS